jgi:hypothetical protein
MRKPHLNLFAFPMGLLEGVRVGQRADAIAHSFRSIDELRYADHTAEDCQAWMREVGFSKTRVEPLVGADSMVIGLK